MNEADYILVTYKKLGSVKATKIECGVSEQRPLCRIEQSPNALKIAKWRDKHKKN